MNTTVVRPTPPELRRPQISITTQYSADGASICFAAHFPGMTLLKAWNPGPLLTNVDLDNRIVWGEDSFVYTEGAFQVFLYSEFRPQAVVAFSFDLVLDASSLSLSELAPIIAETYRAWKLPIIQRMVKDAKHQSNPSLRRLTAFRHLLQVAA